MNPGYSQMSEYVAAFPNMWEEAWQFCAGFEPAITASPSGVLLSGMGGSSIGGVLLGALGGNESRFPIVINRSYSVPGWVDDRTLAVFTSYSGNTEETIAAFDDAGRRGAQRVAITTGGQLASRCEEQNVPFLIVPAELPPRAALPYTFVPLLHLAVQIQLLSLSPIDIAEATEALHDLSRDQTAGNGEADEIARRIHGRLPVIYSGPGLLSAVNLRWRGQIQENAKSLAFGNVYPELNHNEIVGWQASNSIAEQIVVIELADEDDADAVRRRMDLTRSLLESKAADWIRVTSSGKSRLARMMRTVLLGDWVSLRLSDLKQVDPMPVELIEALKAGLANP